MAEAVLAWQNWWGGVVRPDVRRWATPSVVLGFATLAIHLLVNGRYGFFRDELYFIVCGQHPAWGYVDQPPLVPLIAAWSYAAFGSFLSGFRLVPALAMTATVALTTDFTRRVGGGRFAQWLAGLCVLGAGIFLAHGMLISTDMFQALTWLACSWCVVRVAQTGDQRWWIALGAVVGFSLLGKYLIAFYLGALAVGLLFTPLRRSLLHPWLYVGVAIALVAVLPNILWQWQHGWPFIELGEAGPNEKNMILSPQAFLIQELMLIGPAAAPVWLAGLWATAVRPKNPVWRAFAIAYAVLFAVFVVSHGKAYYLAPVYPTLLGFGAVAMEHWLTCPKWRVAILTAVTAVGAFLAPLAIPVLPVDTFITYAKDIGFVPSKLSAENIRLTSLPQQFADMFGWPEMADRVATIYRQLPPAERDQAVFYGQNYGEAAAIDVFGGPLGLPPAISGHNNYFLWGPRGHDGKIIIVIGGNRKQMEKQFGSVKQVGFIDTPNAIPHENDQPIYLLRDAKLPLPQMWPKLKHFE